jgi:membrane-bound lytic murein transglycosylase A
VTRQTPALLTVLLVACATEPPSRTSSEPPEVSVPISKPPVTPPQAVPQIGIESSASFEPRTWTALAGWSEDDPRPALLAFTESCRVLAREPLWQPPCEQANGIKNESQTQIREFFERRFTPYQVIAADGGHVGLITGYYEPLLKGSRKASARYRYPVHGVPGDLVVVDLPELDSEQKPLKLRGRREGQRIVPYYRRAEIENGKAQLKGREIVWVDDAIELFFLHVQGSGRVRLDSGQIMRVGYAEHNGHPYRSIGKRLVERGELALEQASMQGIKVWARSHPGKVKELLNYNERYVFFRELPRDSAGPMGSLNVPLTPGRSLAIDPSVIPMGAPVYLSTTWPASDQPLNRLMLAQDAGGAIKGALRADFFWGFGEEAGTHAGRMKQSGRLWVLMPNGAEPRENRPNILR